MLESVDLIGFKYALHHVLPRGSSGIRRRREGSKGIELTMNNNTLADGTYTQVAYIEVLRYATLNDGHLEVFSA